MATTQRRGRPASTTKRVAATKKPAAPFELTSAKGDDEFDEREPLFSLNGAIYTVLVRVPTSVALEYLFTLANSEGEAIAFALDYALGAVSRRALMTHKGLTQEQLRKIVDVVRAKFDGALKDPKELPAGD